MTAFQLVDILSNESRSGEQSKLTNRRPKSTKNTVDKYIINTAETSLKLMYASKLYRRYNSSVLSSADTIKSRIVNKIVTNTQLKEYIIKENFSYDSLVKLNSFISQMKDYFEESNIKYEIKDELFVDAEYPEWQEIKIIVAVNKKLSEIFNDIRPKVYQMADKLPIEINKKMMIKFESID